jgi:hypothetical protein
MPLAFILLNLRSSSPPPPPPPPPLRFAIICVCSFAWLVASPGGALCLGVGTCAKGREGGGRRACSPPRSVQCCTNDGRRWL